jgi:hypothetical protein
MVEPTPNPDLREKVARIVAQDPDIFSIDPVLAHRAASPVRVDHARARLLAKADAIHALYAETIRALGAESAALTKALTGLTCNGSEFFIRKGDRYTADIDACVTWVRRAKEDAHRRTVDAIRDRQAAEARARALQSKVEVAEGALREAVFGLEVTDACLRTWNDNRGGPADVEGILSRARAAIGEVGSVAGEAGASSALPHHAEPGSATDREGGVSEYCPWCSEAIRPGEPTGISDGERMHLSCAAEEMDNATFDRDLGN